MKRSLLLIGTFVFAVLSSCTFKEEIATEQIQTVFRGVLEDGDSFGATKAYADKTSLKFYWNTGDEVTIFAETTHNRKFLFAGRDGITSGQFSGPVNTDDWLSGVDIESGFNYAILPFDKDNSCDYDGTLTVHIPDNQSYVHPKDENDKNVGANLIMTARDAERDFTFKHVGGYLGFQFYGEGVKVRSVTFKGNNNEILAGYPLITYSAADEPELVFNPNAGDNKTSITLLCDPVVELGATDNECKIFWFTLPPIILSNGFTVSVQDDKGRVFEKSLSSRYQITRRVLGKMGALEVIPVGTPDVYTYELELSANLQTISFGDEVEFAVKKTTFKNGEKESEENVQDAVLTIEGDGDLELVDGYTYKGKEGGTAKVKASLTIDGTQYESNQVSVTIQDVVSYALTIAPATAEVIIGQTLPITLTLVTTINGEEEESIITSNATWTSSGDAATVDAGVVYGVQEGNVTIYASFKPEGADDALSASVEVTVNKDPNHAGDPTPIEEENI